MPTMHSFDDLIDIN